MVEHNGECKPFDFCPTLYSSTPETTAIPTGPNCNGREEPAIGLPAPEYLSVPNWQECTAITFSEDCSHNYLCLLPQKPANCLEDSWSQLHDLAELESC